MPAIVASPLANASRHRGICHPADGPAVTGVATLGEGARKIGEEAARPDECKEPALASARQMAFASRRGASPVRSITHQADRSATGPVAQAADVLASAARWLGGVRGRRPDQPAADLP